MKEKLNKLLNTFQEFWKAQDKKRKILYIGVLAGVVLVAVIVTIILNTTHYVVLYDGLETSEAGEIVSEIQEMGVDVNLSGDGKITVPEDQESSLRMQLGIMGYPKSTLSYDVWNNNVDMFTTDYEKREQARMQMQERLSGTFEMIPGVEKAVVTLSIPEQKDTVITVNAKQPTASVTLSLRENTDLTSKQIQGIRQIVKTAISGMTEENVTITDGTGRLLLEDDTSDDGTQQLVIENNKLRFKQQYQETIKEAILEQLIPAYGEDGVSVAVNASLNYDKKVSENTEYTPSHEDGSGMISEQDKTNASGTNGSSGGVVGEEPNTDGTYPTGTDDDTGAWSQNTESTNYLVNTLKEQIEKQGFSVDDLTVSVMVYKDQLGENERTTLQANAASAAGALFDSVSIGNLPKYNPDIATGASGTFPFGWSRQQFLMFISALILLIFLFTVLYVFTARKAKQKRLAIERQILAAAHAAGENGEVEGFFGVHGEPGTVPSLTEAAAAETKETAIRREIGEFAKNSPEIVAQLLRNWLREEENSNGRSSGGRQSAGAPARR